MPTKKLSSDNKTNNGFQARRLFAFVLDFIIVNRLSVLVSALMFGLLHGEVQIVLSYDGLSRLQIILIVLSIIAMHFMYYVIIPVRYFQGATIAQRIMQIRVIHFNGRDLSLSEMAMRYFCGCVLLEGLFYDLSGILKLALAYMISPTNALIIERILSVPVILISLYSLARYIFAKGKPKFLHDILINSEIRDGFIHSNKIL